MPLKVKIDGTWQAATAKVKVAGIWKAAHSWTKVSGTWRRDAQDWDLATGNTSARGITWAGAYFYVADHGDDKVYVYDASMGTTSQTVVSTSPPATPPPMA